MFTIFTGAFKVKEEKLSPTKELTEELSSLDLESIAKEKEVIIESVIGISRSDDKKELNFLCQIKGKKRSILIANNEMREKHQQKLIEFYEKITCFTENKGAYYIKIN